MERQPIGMLRFDRFNLTLDLFLKYFFCSSSRKQCRYETLSLHLRHSAMVRRWFSENALLSVSGRLAEYILIAPTPELRSMFVKLIVFLCHFAMNDEPLQGTQTTQAESLCEQILLHVLYLLKTDVPDNGKHLTQYFTLFTMFAGMNVQQKQQLLKVCDIQALNLYDQVYNSTIANSFAVECAGVVYASRIG